MSSLRVFNSTEVCPNQRSYLGCSWRRRRPGQGRSESPSMARIRCYHNYPADGEESKAELTGCMKSLACGLVICTHCKATMQRTLWSNTPNGWKQVKQHLVRDFPRNEITRERIASALLSGIKQDPKAMKHRLNCPHLLGKLLENVMQDGQSSRLGTVREAQVIARSAFTNTAIIPRHHCAAAAAATTHGARR